ncbi:MAG: hypothetical protein E6L06_08355, partial [Verrucomicrobia bacterium]
MNPITAPACASFQHVRHAKRIADLAHIAFATIFHHASPADDFETGDLRQLAQNVVLHTIGEDRVFFLLVQIFKRENGNSVRQGTRDKFTFPNNPARSCRQCHQRRCKYRAGWIAPHPFLSSRENSRMPRLN